MFEKRVMQMLYGKAQTPEDLPWHASEPSAFLKYFLDDAENKRALDLGCGTGVASVALAKAGFDVTAIDFIPKAIEMAEERARDAGVSVNLVKADLLEWESDGTFDLVHDSGTLHSIPTAGMPRYKDRLLGWTREGTDLALAHWGKRGFFDWRPIGPHRRTRESLKKYLSPHFEEKEYASELMEQIPLPFGPSVLGQSFWFKRR